MIYRLAFNEQTHFPIVFESIRIKKCIHPQLQYNGISSLLPQWFARRHNANLAKKLNMLKNIPSFIKSIAAENRRTLLQEFRQSPLYKPQRRLPFSPSMIDIPNICDAICIFTDYKLVIKKFPMHTTHSIF